MHWPLRLSHELRLTPQQFALVYAVKQAPGLVSCLVIPSFTPPDRATRSGG